VQARTAQLPCNKGSCMFPVPKEWSPHQKRRACTLDRSHARFTMGNNDWYLHTAGRCMQVYKLSNAQHCLICKQITAIFLSMQCARESQMVDGGCTACAQNGTPCEPGCHQDSSSWGYKR